METYFETFQRLRDKIEKKPEITEDSEILKKAWDGAIANIKNWRAVVIEARKYRDSDPDQADIVYQKGLEKFPRSAELFYYYARFLQEVRKDNDSAEEYYRKALEVDPNNTINLGNYANFLMLIRKDNDSAEEYYKKALAADSNNANTLGNYAGFLLARGANDKGFELLQRTLELSREDESLKSLYLECLFYNYSHSKDKKAQESSLTEIKKLLIEGIRSPGWDLSGNVKRAIKEGHPSPDFLDKLAKVIADELEIEQLYDNVAWSLV